MPAGDVSGTETVHTLEQKAGILRAGLRKMGAVAVAFSGGVDSSFLLKAAHETLDGRVCAVTVRSCVSAKRELLEAEFFCRELKIPMVTADVDLFEVDGFAGNPPDRCYHCKKRLLQAVISIAREKGFSHVSEGSNADDDGDYRPGFAAVRELSVSSPLRDAGLTKDEVRALSRQAGLLTFDKPAFACLASRIPYGEPVTEEKLRMIERAEDALLGMGLKQVRVRAHGNLARVETDEEGFLIVGGRREEADRALRDAGFLYVSLDLRGYRMGSFNETIKTGEEL